MNLSTLPALEPGVARTLARMLERRMPGLAQDVASQADVTPPLGQGAEAWLDMIVRADDAARLRLAATFTKLAPADDEVVVVRREIDGSRPRQQQAAFGVAVLGFAVAAGMLLFGDATPRADAPPVEPVQSVEPQVVAAAAEAPSTPAVGGRPTEATPPAASRTLANGAYGPLPAPTVAQPAAGAGASPGTSVATTPTPAAYGPPAPAVTPLAVVPAALPPVAPVAPAAPVPAPVATPPAPPLPAPPAPAIAAQPSVTTPASAVDTPAAPSSVQPPT